jgi:hypothetical protein
MDKFKKFAAHPVTKEVTRFAAYTAVTVIGKWAVGKAVGKFQARAAAKAAQLANEAQQSPRAPQPHQHNGMPQA